MSDNNAPSICTRCGGPRVQSSNTTRQSGNPLYPITVIQYRCINVECQQTMEKKQAEILAQRLEREERSREKKQQQASTKV